MPIISRGIKWMFAASFLFALMNLCVKRLPHIPAIEIVFFRSVVTLLMSVWALRRASVPILGNNRKVLVLRGLFGAIALLLFFMLLQRIPLASAAVLHFIAPIFTALMAAVVLKERLLPLQFAFMLLSFAGILVMKSFDWRIGWLDVSMGVLSAFCAGCAYNCIRYLKGSEHPVVIVLYFPLVTVPLTIVWLFFDWVMPQGYDWLWLLAIGVLTQWAQVLMTKAYQAESAAKVAAASYIGIVYALGLGYVFFHETFTWQTLAGMLLVLAGVILNVVLTPALKKKQQKEVTS
ncbi:drug/metabolite transporter (DMT)-like permease [Thermonema lapsum]|uniref:Drug/metabolite transporter (DMT)-like permease n=1 Tax=Thermonema lapsum TaxID=28195 RepID=A0A846MQA1_9BACT|nr:DMT family transporter [Thermonema lapsum]NIK73639.1 drug/metabolite transporter (DMT)-like permease [Thermonema lapsum]